MVPGRAFDHQGRRVGRGGGMYDRYLSQGGRTAPAVGIAYACPVFDEGVEAGAHDAPLDALITEDERLRFA